MSIRLVKKPIKSKPTAEGAGVHLRRAFGFGSTSEYDPFLLLDDFRNDIPADFLAGFPWHPHRGIETITYVLAGTVEHGDSMGNPGPSAAGDVQRMTAGTGIIHQGSAQGGGWVERARAGGGDQGSLVLFDRGDEVVVQAGDEGIRFLLVSGKPLQEPVAWYGPIVMNTQEQLQKAFEEIREGTFLKTGSKG